MCLGRVYLSGTLHRNHPSSSSPPLSCVFFLYIATSPRHRRHRRGPFVDSPDPHLACLLFFPFPIFFLRRAVLLSTSDCFPVACRVCVPLPLPSVPPRPPPLPPPCRASAPDWPASGGCRPRPAPRARCRLPPVSTPSCSLASFSAGAAACFAANIIAAAAATAVAVAAISSAAFLGVSHAPRSTACFSAASLLTAAGFPATALNLFTATAFDSLSAFPCVLFAAALACSAAAAAAPAASAPLSSFSRLISSSLPASSP